MDVRGAALTQQSQGSRVLHIRHVFCLPLRPSSSSCNNTQHKRVSCCAAIVHEFTSGWEIHREQVQGRLRRVHDEVAQGEAEALSGSLQQHGLWPRPGELLVCRVLRGGRAGQASPFWGFILPEELKLAPFSLADGRNVWSLEVEHGSQPFCHPLGVQRWNLILRLLTELLINGQVSLQNNIRQPLARQRNGVIGRVINKTMPGLPHSGIIHRNNRSRELITGKSTFLHRWRTYQDLHPSVYQLATAQLRRTSGSFRTHLMFPPPVSRA